MVTKIAKSKLTEATGDGDETSALYSTSVVSVELKGVILTL